MPRDPATGRFVPKSDVEYVEQDCGYITPCWVWQRGRHPQGHGMTFVDRRQVYAHRAYYERARGPIPPELEIDHLCRNPPCVNPDHLEPVTHAENIRRGSGAKLDHEKAAAIRASTETTVVLAKRYGVDTSQISRVRTGQMWVADRDAALQARANAPTTPKGTA